jgi:hypothetical protein
MAFRYLLKDAARRGNSAKIEFVYLFPQLRTEN